MMWCIIIKQTKIVVMRINWDDIIKIAKNEFDNDVSEKYAHPSSIGGIGL